MVRFAEVLADEVRDHNVQVNCMAPGAAYSHMTDEILNAGEDRAGRKEIEDAHGYLDALGIKRTEEVKRDARIGKALANREATIQEAKAARSHDPRAAGPGYVL